MTKRPPSRPVARRFRRASILVIVMITILFTVFALVAFMERASNDLLVEQREAEGRRLRMEAYSALEVTLAVLEDFRTADSGLHSPAEGWTDPLGFAGYTPTDGRTVEVSFEDESGKLSVAHLDAQILSRLFQSWNVLQPEADSMADALVGWMTRGHTYSTGINPDYEQSALPYDEPQRPLRSFSELADIDIIRDKFFDEQGRPNDLWKRFAGEVSLLDFKQTNLNGAGPDVITALGQFNPVQQQTLTDYLSGTGAYQTQGPGYFQNLNDAQHLAGNGGNAQAFDTNISALRVNVTVHEGRSLFRISAVVTMAPGGGAKTITTTASDTRQQQQTSAAGQNANGAQNQTNANQSNGASANANSGSTATSNSTASAGQNGQNNGQARNLAYPFTLLEIRENDEIPPPPPPPLSPNS